MGSAWAQHGLSIELRMVSLGHAQHGLSMSSITHNSKDLSRLAAARKHENSEMSH